MMSACTIRAAEYLRTSTLQQPYSIDAQKRVIREYADRNGFKIVRSYVDRGKSGLALASRPGLSALLGDIAYGQCEYSAVLVYDVSRWGRFQDGDESAHYEFLCKAMNVPIHYCAESFVNDNQLQNFILKSLKRTVAAEYSRELSVKCFRGQKRLVEMGFKTGGTAGYGLRRLAISADGQRTNVLNRGERKSIATDRILLVPGPKEEVEVVRMIFEMAAIKDMSYCRIASELNRRGILYQPGQTWPDYVIHRMLSDKKYMGSNVWNLTTGKLGTKRRRNPQDEWIIVPNAFEAIVDPSTFEKAQWVRPNGARWKQEQLLRTLESLKAPPSSAPSRIPSLTTIRRRLIGMPCLRSARGTAPLDTEKTELKLRQRVVGIRNQIFNTLRGLFPDQITEFHLSRKSRPILRVANRFPISVIVCRRIVRITGIMRWRFQPIKAEAEFVTLVCLQFPACIQYFLLPRVTIDRDIFVGTRHPLFKAGIRLKRLEQLLEALAVFQPAVEPFLHS